MIALYCRWADSGGGGRGNVPHHVKKKGNCPGRGTVRGGHVRGNKSDNSERSGHPDPSDATGRKKAYSTP